MGSLARTQVNLLHSQELMQMFKENRLEYVDARVENFNSITAAAEAEITDLVTKHPRLGMVNAKESTETELAGMRNAKVSKDFEDWDDKLV